MADVQTSVGRIDTDSGSTSESCPATHLASDALTQIVAGLASIPRVVTDETGGLSTEPRSLRLIATDSYDVWLITWPPGSGIDEHDHGDSMSVLKVVSGCLIDTGETGEIVVGTDNSLVTPPGQRHRLHNPLPIEATTVHAYSPPLEAMTYYPGRQARDQHPAGRALMSEIRRIHRSGAEATSVSRAPVGEATG